MITRAIQSFIESQLFLGKIIIIYGPRQVGKTTLAKLLLEKYGDSNDYYTADDYDIIERLSNQTSTTLGSFVWSKKMIVIDEAQRIPNIGLTLKLLHDFYPQTQIIATGSSSFDLANNINEPLTGRKFTYLLHPFSLGELLTNQPLVYHQRMLSEYLQYGFYPDVYLHNDSTNKQKLLEEIKNSYLYKDILNFRKIRKPELIIKLLQALALQLGNEVSYNELGQLLGVDKQTIEEYITILEQAFIVYKLPSLQRNMRNELKKSKKIYFWDIGIRNALINNTNPLHLRSDNWAIRENVAITERKKYLDNNQQFATTYFWRTQTQQEIDYIEEMGWMMNCYECKRWKKSANIPSSFATNYPEYKRHILHPETIREYV